MTHPIGPGLFQEIDELRKALIGMLLASGHPGCSGRCDAQRQPQPVCQAFRALRLGQHYDPKALR